MYAFFIVMSALAAAIGFAWIIVDGSKPPNERANDDDRYPSELGEFSRSDINRAALRLIHGRIPFVFPSYLDGSINDVVQVENVIASLRAEYSEYQPEIMKREIFGWLDYYSKEIAATRRDIETQSSKRSLDRYSAERAAESARADAVLRKLAIK